MVTKKQIRITSLELKNIRNKVTLSKDWWEGKTHILIDMDGTLIGQPGTLFHNLFALGVFFRMRGFGSFFELLRAAKKTKEMLLSGHSFTSNQEAFFETLAKELHASRRKVEDFMSKFFDSEYPFICLFLHSEPYARRLIDLLHTSGRHITLATNAVFGRKEIELRLKASELFLHDFDLVTSWDVMKTAKPHTKFFSDTLNKIGATPENTIMIGNDPFYDLPAHELGIQTLLVGERLTIKDIASEFEFLEVRELAQLLNIIELGNLIRISKEMLQSQQLLNVHKILQAIVVYLEALDRKLPLKRVWVELPNLIMVHIQLFELLQVFQAIDLNDLVSGCLQNFKLGKLAKVKPIEIL